MSNGAGSSDHEYGPNAPTGIRRWFWLMVLAFTHAGWANLAIKTVILGGIGFAAFYAAAWMQSPIAPGFFTWLCPLIIFGLGWISRWVYSS